MDGLCWISWSGYYADNDLKTFINPEHLWKYREFDRSVTPAPSCFGIVQYSVSEVAEYLKTHVMEPVQMVVIDNERALLVDGSHRIKASLMNGFKLIPVEFTHVTMEEAQERFTTHVLSRFIPI